MENIKHDSDCIDNDDDDDETIMMTTTTTTAALSFPASVIIDNYDVFAFKTFIALKQ